MTENTGRPYEVLIVARSMVQIMIRIVARSMELKFELGNPGAGRKC
ncbi:hypothetical protein [Methanosarcina sp. 1.H.T.1A.1]|nr:hypothetical protein [Methanosarcina sp. 1.H.T.1A.1]